MRTRLVGRRIKKLDRYGRHCLDRGNERNDRETDGKKKREIGERKREIKNDAERGS